MQSPPSRITPPSSPDTSRKSALVFVSSLVGILVVLLAILLTTQGAYLKAKIFSQSDEVPTDNLTSADGTTSLSVDDYTKLETHCQQQKEAHISHCGHRPPEEDYTCRITEAEHHYHECLTNTTAEEIEELAAEEEELLNEELEEDLLLEGDTEAEVLYEE